MSIGISTYFIRFDIKLKSRINSLQNSHSQLSNAKIVILFIYANRKPRPGDKPGRGYSESYLSPRREGKGQRAARLKAAKEPVQQR